MDLPKTLAAALPLLLVGVASDTRADTPAAPAEAPATTLARAGTLVVEAAGFQGAAGHAYARLYRAGDDVVKAPWRLVRADVQAGRARFELAELPFGVYALVVHHDVNDNGKIDHAWTGLPAEPLGFSNGFTLGLFSGMPTFDKLRFAFGAGARAVRITVR
jgi:uncharacterized protein (DUF2141 family)